MSLKEVSDRFQRSATSLSDYHGKVLHVLLIMAAATLIFPFKVSNGIFVFATVITLLFLAKDGFRSLSFNLLTFCVVGYFVLEIAGILYTSKENIKVGFFEIEKHLLFLFIPLLFSTFKIDSRIYRFIQFSYVTGCFAAAVFCIYVNLKLSLGTGRFFDEVHYFFSYERVSDPIGLQAVYFALFLSLAVLMVLENSTFTFQRRNGLIKTLLIILATFFLLLIVASGARTAIVALMLIITFNIGVFIVRKGMYKYMFLAAIVPLFFIALIFSNPVVLTRFKDLTHTTTAGTSYGSYFARTTIWKSGLDVLKENFWLGVGIGDQESAVVEKYEENDFQEGVEFRYNMHNQFMQTVLGIGVPGLLFFLLMIAVQAKIALQNRDFLYVSFLMLFCFACLTESVLSRNKGVSYFIFFSFLFYVRNTEIRKGLL